MTFLRAVLSLSVLVVALLANGGARAVDAISVRLDAAAIDLTDAIERQTTDTDRIQVSTAAGADGIVRRIEVRSRDGGSNWAVFALANNGDEQVDRLLVAPHYRMVGSGLLWPDLGASRIVTITPSIGDRPERQERQKQQKMKTQSPLWFGFIARAAADSALATSCCPATSAATPTA